MQPSQRDSEDFAFLFDSALAARSQGLNNVLHLDQAVGIWNYIRIANEIAIAMPPGRLLDWGCGLGQMTYLLRRRGFDATAFDVANAASSLPSLPVTRDLGIVLGNHPTNLPFEAGAFDAVLSCGVLEHVDEFSQPGNEMRSLAEIHRVLKPDGRFLIYQLPQQYTWQEAITRTLKIGYSHPRRFTAPEIRALLAKTGYRVERLVRNNMLPKNLTGLPSAIRSFYSRFARSVIGADKLLSSIPVLNQVAGVMEIVARRAD